MAFGSFLGKKEISKMMLNHTAAKLQLSPRMMRIAEKYGYIYLRLFGFPFKLYPRLRTRTVLSYVSKRKGKVLDIGCSFGVLAFHLAKKGYSVVGIDINPESIELANNIKKILKITNIHFINADFLENNLPPNEFDIVIMVEVLEHIKEDRRAINEVYRILDKGGILIISVPYAKEVKEFTDSSSPSFEKMKTIVMGVPGEWHFRNG
jgi:2-polyprenyl-3-methyl-5-hydroxy-6-metoxy-1,4-benzoquinol methylase